MDTERGVPQRRVSSIDFDAPRTRREWKLAKIVITCAGLCTDNGNGARTIGRAIPCIGKERIRALIVAVARTDA